MTRFLIQRFSDEPNIHDFSYTLIEACKYHNWFYGEEIMKWEYVSDDWVDLEKKEHLTAIPVGGVEFVVNSIEKSFNLKIKPKNIPIELMNGKYLKRSVFFGTEKDVVDKKFVKEHNKIKGYTQITNDPPPGEYLISDLVEFKSEWRGFVYKNELVGLNNYLGEFDVFPNVKIINEMIEKYKKAAPIAYTIDVGVVDKSEDTVLIEVHDFFSCGLYGFSDLRVLPKMFRDWYYSFIESELHPKKTTTRFSIEHIYNELGKHLKAGIHPQTPVCISTIDPDLNEENITVGHVTKRRGAYGDDDGNMVDGEFIGVGY